VTQEWWNVRSQVRRKHVSVSNSASVNSYYIITV
jgi:hypothetical protein